MRLAVKPEKTGGVPARSQTHLAEPLRAAIQEQQVRAQVSHAHRVAERVGRQPRRLAPVGAGRKTKWLCASKHPARPRRTRAALPAPRLRFRLVRAGGRERSVGRSSRVRQRPTPAKSPTRRQLPLRRRRRKQLVASRHLQTAGASRQRVLQRCARDRERVRAPGPCSLFSGVPGTASSRRAAAPRGASQAPGRAPVSPRPRPGRPGPTRRAAADPELEAAASTAGTVTRGPRVARRLAWAQPAGRGTPGPEQGRRGRGREAGRPVATRT